MRSGLVKAATLVAALAGMPPRSGRPYGDAAKDLTEAEALRIARRLERRAYSAVRGMGPAELNAWAARKRRARQTHRGKRGQHKRP